MKISVSTTNSVRSRLERYRPKDRRLRWQYVISGRWDQSPMHSGYLGYYIARLAPGEWLMDAVSWRGELDGVTQEDVDEGRLNDDQIQAMWGQTLEEAQAAHHAVIVGRCTGAPKRATAKQIAPLIYRALLKAGETEVEEPLYELDLLPSDFFETLDDPLTTAPTTSSRKPGR